ncbi:hypothetical protein P3X46_008258 [Hevea brasiliensis]|uniref:Senescence domain-containing protein n=1 Tax=Hevea brasiliensis TaxID=3981 RepID=A0ABQ9MM71_HEVBR|nr:hypothetical protein P3X46_008258 [Hevea brasiliensis]
MVFLDPIKGRHSEIVTYQTGEGGGKLESHEIADGVNKSAQAVQAAESGIRQIGILAHQHTISMIQEKDSLPISSLQPVVAGAAKKTSHAVGQTTKTFMNIISRGEFSSENEENDEIERVDI